MALLTAEQTAAELQRKKNLNIAPTNSANQGAYDKLTPQSPVVPNPVIPKVNNSVTTPLVGPVLNGPRPNVPIPTPNVATPSPVVPKDGRLAGPYPTPSGTIQQGANVVGGKIQFDQPTVPQMQQVPIPTPQQPSLYQDPYARSPQDIAKLASDRIAKILAAGRTARDGALAGTKNAYDYTNTIQGDNRQLRNASLKDSSNPFGGDLNYQQAQNNRNDNIQDTAEDKDYNAAVGQINQKLADLETAAPGDEQAIIDQLEQIERQTGISVAQLQLQQQQAAQGQSNADRTFNYNVGQDQIQNTRNAQNDAYAQDPNNPNNYGQSLTNQLNELKLGSYSTEQKQQATLYEQQVKSGQMSNEAAAYNLAQLKDPNSAKNQADKIDLQLKQIDLKNAPEAARLKLQQLQKEIAQIGVVHYKPQTAAEIAQDKVTLATANKQLADIANGKYPGDKSAAAVTPTTSEEYQKNLKPQFDNHGKLTNAQQIEDQIILSGMSEYEQYKSYIANGIPWTDPIPKKTS